MRNDRRGDFNPLIYSPLANLNNALNKTKRIMQSMVDAGYMKKETAEYQYSRFIDKWDIRFDEAANPCRR